MFREQTPYVMAGKESGLANRSQSSDHSNNKGSHLADGPHSSHARIRQRSPHSHSHGHSGHHAHSPHMEDIQKAELQSRQEESAAMNGECFTLCVCVCVCARVCVDEL